MDPISQLGLPDDESSHLWKQIHEAAVINAYAYRKDPTQGWAAAVATAMDLFPMFADEAHYAGIRQEAEARWASARNHDLLALQESSLSTSAMDEYLAWLDRMDDDDGRRHQWLCAYLLLAEGIIQTVFLETYNESAIDDKMTIGLHFFLSMGYGGVNPRLYKAWAKMFERHSQGHTISRMPIPQDEWINNPPWDSSDQTALDWQLFFYRQRLQHLKF